MSRPARAGLVWITLVLGGCGPHAPTTPAAGTECVVSAVSDGDTIRCADGRRVRLLSIDAPEMAQAPFGELAREQLLELLPLGSAARVELDVEAADRYGRTLAYLYAPGGRMANHEMAARGYAVDLVYEPNVRYADSIRAAVAEARDEQRGLWAQGGFACLPRDFRAGRCQ